MAKNEVPTVKLRRTSAGNLRNFFFIFTVIGVASIAIVRLFPANSLLLQMALPGLVVLFYAIFIFNKGRNVLNLDQLGDSVYYLGFILTLAALILALYGPAINSAAFKNIEALEYHGILDHFFFAFKQLFIPSLT